MVILGLGSNIGDRMQFLREALRHLRAVSDIRIQQVSPVYVSDALLTEDAPETWDLPFLNLAVRIETEIEPLRLLDIVKNIEARIGRTNKLHWSPRPIDIDILAWDDRVIYDDKLHIPHEHVCERPFAMWPLADVAPLWVYPVTGPWQGKTAAEIIEPWGSRYTGEAPLHTRQILQRVDTSAWVGILNLSPDSFSDGGKFVAQNDLLNSQSNVISEKNPSSLIDAFINSAENLVSSGAEILDLGAEATNPGAKPISAETEWARLEPVLQPMLLARSKMLIPPKISIDTRHARVAEKALTLGVDWINDVSGLTDSAMCDVLKNSPCDIVVMHHLSIPSSKTHTLPLNEDPVALTYAWLANHFTTLEKRGIQRERLIADIGIGFGKTAEQSLLLLQQIATFKQLGTRLLVGHSRKSFFNIITSASPRERDIETAVSALYFSNHVDYQRVHAPEHCARASRIAKVFDKSGC